MVYTSGSVNRVVGVAGANMLILAGPQSKLMVAVKGS